MSLNFDSNYYDSNEGYRNYKNYPHFKERAQWIIDRYAEKSFDREIWIIGCGWGWLVKEVRDLLPVDQKVRCKGIVFSSYEKTQSIKVVGLPDGAIVQMDITDYILPDMDILVSWNFLDSIPAGNDTKAVGICNKLINKAKFQTHIICMDTNDPNAESYKLEGYNIQTLAYWRQKFTTVDVPAQHCVLVNYHTGVNSRKTEIGWTTVKDLNIPLCWGRVSN